MGPGVRRDDVKVLRTSASKNQAIARRRRAQTRLWHPGPDPYSTPASCGVNSYTELQNSQVTSTLPSFTMPARSFGAKLFSMFDTASREQEHFATTCRGEN